MKFPQTVFSEKYEDKRGVIRVVALHDFCDQVRQVNVTESIRNTFRGLHFQKGGQQEKLITVVKGAVQLYAVNIICGDTQFFRVYQVTLAATDAYQFWVPKGYAFGFLTTSETSIIAYAFTQPFDAKTEVTASCRSKTLNLQLPNNILLSDKDHEAKDIVDIDMKLFPLKGDIE